MISVLAALSCAPAEQEPETSTSPVPVTSTQMILVTSPSVEAPSGVLHRFARDSSSADWRAVGGATRITLGRNGLGLGIGLHEIDPGSMPLKQEGDGKSPAGVFRLSSAFGYAPSNEMAGLGISYTHVTDDLECVDDVNSAYYNQIVLRSEVGEVDWQSSEQMLMDGIWYETGIVVDHNASPVSKGGGSCIFLHNWSGPDDTTSGCTAMAPSDLMEIVHWLDAEKDPVLVQLTRQLYGQYEGTWGLPTLPVVD
jgi:D-alanyl-D-alanine dipeptidase